MNARERRTISLLLTIIAVLVAAILIVLGLRSRADTETEGEGPQAEGVITEQSAYSAISYNNGSVTLSFALNEGGRWIWADEPDFPLDDSGITALIDLLAELKPQQTITEGDTLDAYGLDQPEMTLTATATEGGTDLQLAFGNTTTDGASYYMLMNGDESPVYIVAGTLVEAMQTPVYDMCALPAFPQLTEDRLDTVAVTAGETERLLNAVRPQEETEESEDEDAVTWTLDGKTMNDAAGSALLETLAALAFDRCVDFKPSNEAAAICGFDAPAAVLTVWYRTEGGAAEMLTLTLGTQAHESDGRYARVNDDTTVYLLPAGQAEAILALVATPAAEG